MERFSEIQELCKTEEICKLRACVQCTVFNQKIYIVYQPMNRVFMRLCLIQTRTLRLLELSVSALNRLIFQIGYSIDVEMLKYPIFRFYLS